MGGKRLGRGEALRQLLPMALSFVLGGIWTVGHGYHVFQEHPFGVLWALGSVSGHVAWGAGRQAGRQAGRRVHPNQHSFSSTNAQHP
jgi:hypothetical protein